MKSTPHETKESEYEHSMNETIERSSIHIYMGIVGLTLKSTPHETKECWWLSREEKETVERETKIKMSKTVTETTRLKTRTMMMKTKLNERTITSC